MEKKSRPARLCFGISKIHNSINDKEIHLHLTRVHNRLKELNVDSDFYPGFHDLINHKVGHPTLQLTDFVRTFFKIQLYGAFYFLTGFSNNNYRESFYYYIDLLTNQKDSINLYHLSEEELFELRLRQHKRLTDLKKILGWEMTKC
jgi:hypothetical protein